MNSQNIITHTESNKEKIFGSQEWVGKEITLKPISKHGKDRINQYGNKWKVTAVSQTIMFSSESGPWLRLESLCGTEDIRWVRKNNDKNFEVIF